MEANGQMPLGTVEAVQQKIHEQEQEAAKAPHRYDASDERVRAIIERYEQQVRDLQKGWCNHIHDFQYCLNANHTAIRGCRTCGYTCGTLVQGNDPRQLEWHPIREPEEQEEMQEGGE